MCYFLGEARRDRRGFDRAQVGAKLPYRRPCPLRGVRMAFTFAEGGQRQFDGLKRHRSVMLLLQPAFGIPQELRRVAVWPARECLVKSVDLGGAVLDVVILLFDPRVIVFDPVRGIAALKKFAACQLVELSFLECLLALLRVALRYRLFVFRGATELPPFRSRRLRQKAGDVDAWRPIFRRVAAIGHGKFQGCTPIRFVVRDPGSRSWSFAGGAFAQHSSNGFNT